MKVKCIDKRGYSGLTMGKTYEVMYIYDSGDYYIIDDLYYDGATYPKKCFKPLSEIRNETIDKLLE